MKAQKQIKIGEKVVVLLKDGELRLAEVLEKKVVKFAIEIKVQLDNDEIEYVSPSQVVTRRVSDEALDILSGIGRNKRREN